MNNTPDRSVEIAKALQRHKPASVRADDLVLANGVPKMKVHPRLTMELARHSDMRLMMKTYTDTGQLL